MKPCIAITGPEGLVGSAIIGLLNKDIEFIPLPRNEVDITDWESVKKRFESVECDYILHLAAYTNVDGAENEPELAHAINVIGTQNIAKIAKNKNIKLIHVSTDFVFDGTNPPYDENSVANPLGIYAKTKWLAERILIDNGKLIMENTQRSKNDDAFSTLPHGLPTANCQLPTDVMIVRISYPYRLDDYPRKDFVRTIKWLLEQRREIAGICDCLITPTYIDDIAYALKYLVNNFSNEIFHIVGGESISPYDTFQLIARHWDLDASLIKPATFDDYFAGKAPRPKLGKTISVKNTFHPMRSLSDVL